MSASIAFAPKRVRFKCRGLYDSVTLICFSLSQVWNLWPTVSNSSSSIVFLARRGLLDFQYTRIRSWIAFQDDSPDAVTRYDTLIARDLSNGTRSFPSLDTHMSPNNPNGQDPASSSDEPHGNHASANASLTSDADYVRPVNRAKSTPTRVGRAYGKLKWAGRLLVAGSIACITLGHNHEEFQGILWTLAAFQFLTAMVIFVPSAFRTMHKRAPIRLTCILVSIVLSCVSIYAYTQYDSLWFVVAALALIWLPITLLAGFAYNQT